MSATLLISMGALQGGSDQWSAEAAAGHTPSIEGAHAGTHVRRGRFKLFDHWLQQGWRPCACASPKPQLRSSRKLDSIDLRSVFTLYCRSSLANFAHHYHSGTMFAFFTNPLCQTMLDPSDPPGHHPPSQPHHTTVHQAAVIFFDTLKDIKSFPKSYFSLVSCCSKTKF